MNGTEVTAIHGYPLRLIVPGHVGVRNVKWLTGIKLSNEEAHGPWVISFKLTNAVMLFIEFAFLS